MKTPWICEHAWSSTYFRIDGRVSPCCRFRGGWSPSDSASLQELRARMLDGEPPAGCEKCVKEEAGGVRSKRLRSLRLSSPDRSGAISYMGFEMGNVCNLRCITCGPHSSTSWNQDAEIAGYDKLPVLDPRLENLKIFAPQIKTLELMGGESFLSPHLAEILDLLLREGNPEDLSLKITTNATVLPSREIQERLERFARVKIIFSLDSIGERNEYIRFPSRWSEIESTIARFVDWSSRSRRIELGIHHTVSAYSFGGLRDLLNWWIDFHGGRGPAENEDSLSVGYVINPEIQSVHALSRAVREKIADSLRKERHSLFKKAHEAADYSLQEDRPDLKEMLHRWTARLDQARGVSARRTIPELFED